MTEAYFTMSLLSNQILCCFVCLFVHFLCGWVIDNGQEKIPIQFRLLHVIGIYLLCGHPTVSIYFIIW